jgi:hypothetical protein
LGEGGGVKREVANELNKQSQTKEMEWFSSFYVGCEGGVTIFTAKSPSY